MPLLRVGSCGFYVLASLRAGWNLCKTSYWVLQCQAKKYMLKVNEEVRSNPPRPKAIIEPLCVIQDQLLVTKSGTLYIQCFEQYVPGTSTQENACSLPPEAEGMGASWDSATEADDSAWACSLAFSFCLCFLAFLAAALIAACSFARRIAAAAATGSEVEPYKPTVFGFVFQHESKQIRSQKMLQM
ncbi:MAG: hypothetical protein FRX49_11575 [Trebouxia sp. A1-2]|nr:MAG: hypothetical protein FRX49_11575 [Trebouxia sp. A1-2]